MSDEKNPLAFDCIRFDGKKVRVEREEDLVLELRGVVEWGLQQERSFTNVLQEDGTIKTFKPGNVTTLTVTFKFDTRKVDDHPLP